MKRLILSLLVVLTTCCFFIFPAHAQSGVFFDFTAGAQGWGAEEGRISSGDPSLFCSPATLSGGWYVDGTYDGDGCNEDGLGTSLWIHYTFTSPATLGDVMGVWDANYDLPGVTTYFAVCSDYSGHVCSSSTGYATSAGNVTNHSGTVDASGLGSLSDVWIYLENSGVGFDDASYIRLKSVTLEGDVPPPDPPDGENPGAAFAFPPRDCFLLGTKNANFTDPNDWTFSTGADYYETAPNESLNLEPGAYATLGISNLSPEKEYDFEAVYEGTGTDNGSFTIQIGSQTYDIPVEQDSDQHTYNHPGVKPLTDDPGHYTITISRPSDSPNDVVIRYFCISRSSVSIGAHAQVVSGGEVTGACVTCDPPLNWTDIIGIINWLLCNIRNFFGCWLLPALAQWLGFLVLLVRYFVSWVLWVINFQSGFVNWIGQGVNAVVGFIGGHFKNLIISGVNGMHQSGLADAANVSASAARDLPTTLTNLFNQLGGELSDIFLTSHSLVELVLRLIWFVFSAIVRVLFLIPLVIQSLIYGLQSSGGPISGSPVCNDDNSPLYWPCLGFYVLDNTIFAGPVRFLFPVLVGVVCFDNITWAINRFKEELGK